jgi:Bacterial TSP3 repeat
MSKRIIAPVLMLAWLLAPPVAMAKARDHDRDGLPDRWEKRYGLSTTNRSATGDPDHDRLTNKREYRRKTNPRRRDTDRDGLRDGLEVKRYKTNPRKKDTDGDGLNDRAEIKRYHTNPRKKDTDGDGFSDRAEIRAGTNPRDASSHPPGAAGSPPPPPALPPGPSVPPTPANVGVPVGWVPAQTRSSDLTVSTPGAVVQDILFTRGNLNISAPNVTVRRVKMQGGRINNAPGGCQNGLVVQDSTFEAASGADRSPASDTEGVTGLGGYTAQRVLVWNRAEGFRAGGKGSGCGPVLIQGSFARVNSPSGCGDWHGDGLQGYDGPALTLRNVTIELVEDLCGGTAPFFVPSDQGNTSVDVDGLLVKGGGFSFRNGVPGSVRGLKIVDRGWSGGPVDVKCSVLSAWDAQLVTIDAGFNVTSVRGAQRCTGTGN